MKISLVKVTPSKKKNSHYFVDFFFDDWGLLIKGCKVRILKKAGLALDFPYLYTDDKKFYSPMCFKPPELYANVKKLMLDEFVRSAVKFNPEKGKHELV